MKRIYLSRAVVQFLVVTPILVLLALVIYCVHARAHTISQHYWSAHE